MNGVNDLTAFGDAELAAVRDYLRRRVGPDADRLAEETIVTAFAERESCAGSPRAWLLGIATRLVPERAEERRLRAARRHGSPVGALASLARGDRDALLLHVWGGLCEAECAAALGVPEETLRSRLARARAHVRERMRPGADAFEVLRESP